VSEKPNPMAWREAAAVADMHARLAAKKLNVVMTKDSPNLDQMLAEIGKAVECIEFAHDAAMKAYNEFAELSRRSSRVTARGVRLSAVKQHQASNATIAELIKK
jgi:hypothetical protein